MQDLRVGDHRHRIEDGDTIREVLAGLGGPRVELRLIPVAREVQREVEHLGEVLRDFRPETVDVAVQLTGVLSCLGSVGDGQVQLVGQRVAGHAERTQVTAVGEVAVELDLADAHRRLRDVASGLDLDQRSVVEVDGIEVLLVRAERDRAEPTASDVVPRLRVPCPVIVRVVGGDIRAQPVCGLAGIRVRPAQVDAVIRDVDVQLGRRCRRQPVVAVRRDSVDRTDAFRTEPGVPLEVRRREDRRDLIRRLRSEDRRAVGGTHLRERYDRCLRYWVVDGVALRLVLDRHPAGFGSAHPVGGAETLVWNIDQRVVLHIGAGYLEGEIDLSGRHGVDELDGGAVARSCGASDDGVAPGGPLRCVRHVGLNPPRAGIAGDRQRVGSVRTRGDRAGDVAVGVVGIYLDAF